jgi:hypothetical protein
MMFMDVQYMTISKEGISRSGVHLLNHLDLPVSAQACLLQSQRTIMEISMEILKRG